MTEARKWTAQKASGDNGWEVISLPTEEYRVKHLVADYLSEDAAKLIAAAPDLYEALKALYERFNPDESTDVAKNARAALAKARGE